MKPAQIFNQYIWIINTLKTCGKLTLAQLDQKWRDAKKAEGNPLPRSSFNRHRDAIRDMFGVDIECEPNTYKYYISNPEVLNNDSIERHLFSTLAVHGMLADSASIRDRILMEYAPAGEEFLEPIIRAMKTGHRLRMGYKKFEDEGYVKTVCPYALKRSQQRWYLLALNDKDQLRCFALDDRMNMMEPTDETFDMPEDFSPEGYFADYFGVLTVDIPMAHVVVRAYDRTPYYLRTLPLHHSQRELQSGDNYTDFAFDIRPTDDFLNKLFSYRKGIEVLEPADVRQRMKDMIAEMAQLYK